jgi:hypothetical protein|tara:strand:+ start:180 stop:452 length:273 start_codon:yes stop_codon:yes gene_type:complete
MIALTTESPIGGIRSFVGEKDLLIIGDGSVVIEKSLDKGENFYPITDQSGDIVLLESDESVIYNAKIENSNGVVQYRVVLKSGSASYEVV